MKIALLPNRTYRPLVLAVHALLFASALLHFGCAERSEPATGRVRVVAGILPYADIAAQIGGSHVEVATLIPSGKDPHTFDLDPRRVQNASDADVVIFNGAGLEMWSDRIAEGLSRTTQIIWIDRLLEAAHLEDEHTESGHTHAGNVNPHFWLDPVLMKTVATEITRALIAADPKREADYTRGSTAFIARLDSLDSGIRNGIQQWRTRKFVTTHPAWAYFCKRYGLQEAGVLEAGPGKEISAKQMAAIARRMQADGLNVIFTQYMFPDVVAKALARETGSRLAELDPHGSTNSSVHYIELMKYNFDIMNGVMK